MIYTIYSKLPSLTLFIISSLAFSFSANASQVVISPTFIKKEKSKDFTDTSIKIKHMETNLVYQKDLTDSASLSFNHLLSGEHELSLIQKGTILETIVMQIQPGQLSKVNVILDRESLKLEYSKPVSYSTNLSEDIWNQIPVKNNITDYTLLLPGTTLGDSEFGHLPAISGGTVAENRFELNGFSLTNQADGLSQHTMPTEMLESLSIDHSSYGGGKVSLGLKRGTNEFKSGFSVNYLPSFLSKDKPSSIQTDGLYRIDNRDTAQDNLDVNLWSSGPLIEDTLFYYAIYNPRVLKSTTHSGQTIDSNQNITQHTNNYKNDSALWATKLDWHISKGQRFEYITFSDKQRKLSNEINITAEPKAFGGQVTQFNYYGQLTNNLSFTSSHSYSSDEVYSPHPWNDNPAVYFRSYAGAGIYTVGGQYKDFIVTKESSKQEQTKLNLTWQLNNHLIQLEQGSEKVTRQLARGNSGEKYYLYYMDDSVPGQQEPSEVRVREYTRGLNSQLDNNYLSISDTWLLSDFLSVDLNLKTSTVKLINDDTDENRLTFGQNVSYQIGIEYEINNKSHINVTVDKQYQPPLLAGLDLVNMAYPSYSQSYYTFEGYIDEQLGIPLLTNSPYRYDDLCNGYAGCPAGSNTFSKNLKLPIITSINLDYNLSISQNWQANVHLMHKVLDNAIEDIDGGYRNYILINPGNDVFATRCDDGVCEYIWKAQDLGYPKAQRTYNQISINTVGNWNNGAYINMTYSWSRLEGNYEGLISSDTNQTGPNTTVQFDTPEYTEGSYGLLPNDRTHQVTFFGHYPLTEEFNVGFNLSLQSGRPINSFGYHPDHITYDRIYDGIYYSSRAFYAEGTFSPRGSRGRTPPISNLNISASYQTRILGSTAEFRIDIFNVFNTLTETEVDEFWDNRLNDESILIDESTLIIPTKSDTYGLATQWQTPMSVQLSSRFTF